MNKKILIGFAVLSLLLLVIACKKSDVSTDQTKDLSQAVESGQAEQTIDNDVADLDKAVDDLSVDDLDNVETDLEDIQVADLQ